MNCLKCDSSGDCACDFAKKRLDSWNMQCEQECVNSLNERLEKEIALRNDAEKKLKKYQDAIRPFLANCRACVELAEDDNLDKEAK